MVTTLDQKLVELLNDWQPNGWPIGNLILVCIAILLSVILCGVIGIEREWKGRSAGLRTHLLVGVGSCIIMIISIYGFPAIFGEKRDVARLAAQVIAGVGFLGAGAIIHRNDGIKGLTTAGTIWIVMAIGIACGSFNFIIAVVATLVILFVLTVFKKVESKISNRKIIIVLTTPMDEPVTSKILSISKEFDCVATPLSNDLITEDGVTYVQCTLQAVFNGKDGKVTEYLSKLKEETKAVSIHTLNDHR